MDWFEEMEKKKPTRKEKGERTRKELFDAAMSLYTKKGYERVTVEDICAKAGVSKGAFYTHFMSKDQVVLETFLKADDFYREVFPQLDQEKSCIDKLRAFGRLAMGNIVNQGPMVIRVSYYGQIAPGRENAPIASRERPLYKLTEQLIREGQEKGEIRADIPSAAITEIVIHAIRGIVYDWCLQQGEFDLEECGGILFQMLLEGLQSPH